MNEFALPEVTPDDVLAGYKEIPADTRDGKTIKLNVRALPWRDGVRAGNLSMTDPAEAVIYCVPLCLPEEQRTDEFLNKIVPHHMSRILHVALLLSQGVNEAKKRKAERDAASLKSASDTKSVSPPSAS